MPYYQYQMMINHLLEKNTESNENDNVSSQQMVESQKSMMKNMSSSFKMPKMPKF